MDARNPLEGQNDPARWPVLEGALSDQKQGSGMPRTIRLRSLGVFALGIGAIVLVVAVAWSLIGGSTRTINGTLVLNDKVGALTSLALGGILWPAGECIGGGGYDDINQNAVLKILDEKGAVIGTAPLGIGTLDPKVVGASLSDAGNLIRAGRDSCTFHFTFDGVPQAKLYTLELAQRHGPDYTPGQLDSNNNTVSLTLGGD